MSTTTGTATSPPITTDSQTDVQLPADEKSEGSARSTDTNITTAVENEEQLLGVGQLPKDVQAEEELKEAIQKAFGPPPPTLD
ncbi:hypothetical protein M3Y97_00292900 [Aphelenchoides bicaudatus]|nr:hypothetical protein M3Y97_00292900 [Aphelenchoides bicaudatus]